MDIIQIIALMVLIVIIFVAVRSLRIVPQTEVVIIERWGKYHSTLTGGLNVIWPFIDKPRKLTWRYVRQDIGGKIHVVRQRVDHVDLRETIYSFPRHNVITQDNVQIEIKVILFFQISDPIKAVYEISTLPDAIEKLTITTLRKIISELSLGQALASRKTIDGKLWQVLHDTMDTWGVKVHRAGLLDIVRPPDMH
jgi:regulator of protease activity HflC (stomatin/prohibitin superfamily)